MKREGLSARWLRVAHFTSDFFRDGGKILLGFLNWNWQKTRYRWSKGRARCPCQSISDSGRPGETRCEPSQELTRPARFRIVCPALQPDAQGFQKCHLARADVRPYWSRAFLAGFVIFLAVYLVSVSAWWSISRYQGFHQITWIDYAWPAQWITLPEKRATHFRSIAMQAIRENKIDQATIALSSAVDVSSQNFSDALLLAKLYEFTRRFAAADMVFEELLIKFPEHRTQVNRIRHDAMLSSQRLISLRSLAWDQLLEQPGRPNEWLPALIQIIRIENASTAPKIEADRDRLRQLSPIARALVDLASARPTDELEAQVEAVLKNKPTDVLSARLRWEVLWTQGQRVDAQQAIEESTSLLGSFETALARWATLPANVPATLLNRAWNGIIPPEVNPAHVERICAITLLSRRDVSLAPLLVRIPESDRSSLAALWAVAIVQRDQDLANSILQKLGLTAQVTGLQVTPENLSEKLPILTTIVPLPREVMYALIARSKAAPSSRRSRL